MNKPAENTSPICTELYDQEYFEKHCGPIPYTRSEARWHSFFNEVAEQLIRSLKPRTVLDVGCAIGFLIEAFWRRGVRAYGIDISEYAISQVPQDLRSFCRVLSATAPLPEDFPQKYDLITCIEVLEHIPEKDARYAIQNMASRTECILVSSTPDDLTEPTHVNVRPVIYWLQLFAEVGFYPDLRFDASFVSPQAFLVRKEIPRLDEDTLPLFSESINKKFQIIAQQQQIATLTGTNQELEQKLENETRTRDRALESLTQEVLALKQTEHELKEQLQRERTDRQSIQERLEALDREAERLRPTVEQLEKTLTEAANLNEKVRLLVHERDQFRSVVFTQSAAIAERDRKIESLLVSHSGLFWELLVAYRGTKDRCLPPGTRRRRWYDRGLASLKAIKTQQRRVELLLLPLRHPILTSKNLNRARVRKFFYNFRRTDPAVVEAMLKRKFGLNQPVSEPRPPAKLQKFALIISGCPGDAFRYRCQHQAEQLRFLGFTVDTAYFDQVDYERVLECYECYWLHRVPHTDAVEKFIRRVQDIGKPVIFDTDDLVFDEEKIGYIRALQWMPKDEVDLYYDGVRRYYRTLSLCRFATVTTEPLREAIQRLLPQIQCFITSNALSDAQIMQAEEALKIDRSAIDQNVVRIAYFSGTHTHNVDFQECSGALVRVLATYPIVKLMIVGHLDVGAEFDQFGDRIERVPLVPWQDLPKLLRRVDINLAPLELNNPFTEAKSALKFFEAGVVGVPTVASDVIAYRGVMRHGENGFLCKGEAEWFQCLTQLVENTDLQRQMGDRARTVALEELTTRRQVLNCSRVLNQIYRANCCRFANTLSIAFVLRAPIAQVGGGYKVIFFLAHYLARQGHDVHVYVEAIAHLEGKTEAEILEFCRSYFGESSAKIHVGHDAIQSSDIAIATNWPTAFVVDSLVNTRCKAYLIQDYEPEFYEPGDPVRGEVEGTYTLPLKKICIGRYLADLFTERDCLPVASFDFPLDHEIFHSVGRKVSGPIRVLFFARPSLKRRGYSIGIEALDQLSKACPDVQICFYGMEENPRLSFSYTNLGVLDQPQLARAMRDADIHLSFSLSNISQVPFQAMACGCAVVEAMVPSVKAMVEDGNHCLLAKPEPNAIAASLTRLIKDVELRQRLASGGMEFVSDKTWENACKQFEEIVLNSIPFVKLAQREVVTTTSVALAPIGSEVQHSVSAGSIADSGIYYRSCNFCGGREFRVFKRIDLPFPNQIYGDHELTYPGVGKRLKLQYLECASCGLVGINPLTRFSDINRKSFDGERNIVAWADLDYAGYEREKSKEIALVYDQYGLEKFRIVNRVLDVSCGPGVSLKWFRDEKNWIVFGVDPDQHSARTARKRYGIKIETGLIHDLSAPDEYFDLIIMDNSLEHTFDPLATLLKAFRLLRRGGGLFIFTPNSGGLSTRFLNDNAYWGHWFLYSPSVLYQILRRIGFNVPKLCAIQNPINPALTQSCIDIEPYRAGLALSVEGEEKIAEAVRAREFYADFFNLIAVKPNEQHIASPSEPDLIKVAQYSNQELCSVNVVPQESDEKSSSSTPNKEPVIIREHLLAHTLLDGLSGLEIGAAAHNPFGLCTRNVCHPEFYQLYAEEQQKHMGVEPARVDIWASAEQIPVPDESEDYIISSHVVEHLPNLILAFVEWSRIVRDDGYVFMIVPLKGALPEDSNRELTTLSHVLEDYFHSATLHTHSIDGVPGGRGGHYHTFTPDSLLEVVEWMRAQELCNWILVAREDVDTKVGNGFTLVFRVRHQRRSVE
jgi:glycosyltransferase involved in cell wall biosynthesis/2-polyprenyl-3-methyl-5-hydroxy-6-metoxy-1,4-benzoquinol methylase